MPPPMLYYPMYAGGGFGRGAAWREATCGAPASVRRPNYQARPRPTMFSGRGVGGQRGVRTPQDLQALDAPRCAAAAGASPGWLAFPHGPALRVLRARARLPAL